MSTRVFFILALGLPVAGGLVGFVAPGLKALGAALLFGGIPYIPFAAILGVFIWRAPTRARLVRLALISPLAFAPFALAFIAAVEIFTNWRENPVEDTSLHLLPIALYTVAFGYVYVFLAWATWVVARALSLVKDGNAT